jgi:hypothetical protein
MRFGYAARNGNPSSDEPEGRIVQNLNALVQVRGCVGESLSKVLLLEIRIVREQLIAVPIRRKGLEYTLDRDAKAPDAWLAAHFVRLDRDAVKWRL